MYIMTSDYSQALINHYDRNLYYEIDSYFCKKIVFVVKSERKLNRKKNKIAKMIDDDIELDLII